uniref:Uncharacterized protein n=1 Tax=Aegilops tauschii subsp. strangulata TaxID=200361 RepID=A0A453CP09_AEGTS
FTVKVRPALLSSPSVSVFISHAARSPARPAPNSGLARGAPASRFVCSGGSSMQAARTST